MKLFKINDSLSVMPTEISVVRIIEASNAIQFKLKSGDTYAINPEYRTSVFETYNKVTQLINEALL